jgi:hypothetical protein
VELELDPPQPPEVVHALAGLLRTGSGGPDPWWQAGIDDLLDPPGAEQ